MTQLLQQPQPFTYECLACFLQRAIPVSSCDGTAALTQTWMASQKEDTRWLIPWLQQRGGYCDCEVYLNALIDEEPGLVQGLVLCCGDAFEDDEEDYDEE
jgi:hypothetical protein